MRAILAGGGTGGHVIPALAIANQLKKEYSAEILFIGTARGIENRLVPAAGYPLQLVRVGALKNVNLVTRAKTAFDLPRAIWDAGRMLNEFAPDVVIALCRALLKEVSGETRERRIMRLLGKDYIEPEPVRPLLVELIEELEARAHATVGG